MWPGLVKTAKEGGIDVIESYVFWNGHELSPGKVSRKISFICYNIYKCEMLSLLCKHFSIINGVFVLFPLLLNWEILVLFWWAIRSSQICEDRSAGWNVYDSSNWSICCS